MSLLDNSLLEVYKNLFGLPDATSISNNTLLNSNLTINSFLYVSNYSYFNLPVTLLSNLNVSGYTNIIGNITINNNLNVSGNTLIYNDATFNSSVYISGTVNILNNLNAYNSSVMVGNVTLLNSLNVSGTTKIYNTLNANYFKGLNNGPINIGAENINIGNNSSQVNINGTATYIATTDLKISDKIISLNLNEYTLSGIDIGNNCGIEILGTNGNGYIKTTNDATRYEIKPPIGNGAYILTLDSNNQMNISNTSILNNNVTFISSLNISGNTTIENDLTLLSSFNIAGTSLFINSITINSILNVNNDSIFMNNVTLGTSLNVSGNTYLRNTTTILSSLTVSGYTTLLNNTTINSSLNVSGNTVLAGTTSILSLLNISGNTNIYGTTTLLSNLNISGYSQFNNNVTILSSLNVSGNSILINNVSILSSLNVSGNTNIESDVTIMSNLNILSNVIAKLNNYYDNNAAKLAGVPVWGWYRTGGIIKIRLEDVPPTITLNGNTIITNFGSNIVDLGGYVTDNLDSNVILYLSSIMTGTTNLLTTPVVINNTNTTILNTNNLLIGNYTAVYTATDASGNIGYNYRMYSILLLYQLYSYTTANVSHTTIYGGSNPTYNSTSLVCSDNVYIGPSTNILSSLNSNWCIAFKFIPNQNTNTWRFFIDVSFTTSNFSNYIVFRTTRTEIENGSGITPTVTNNSALLINGGYISYGYNTITQNFRLQVADLIGNIIFDGSTTRTFNNTYPLAMQLEGGGTYVNGMLVSQNGFMNYATYSSYYP